MHRIDFHLCLLAGDVKRLFAYSPRLIVFLAKRIQFGRGMLMVDWGLGLDKYLV